MKKKINKLTGGELDYAVAVAFKAKDNTGYSVVGLDFSTAEIQRRGTYISCYVMGMSFFPSGKNQEWTEILERETSIIRDCWKTIFYGEATPAEAVCRCFVQRRLGGDTIDIN